MIDVGNVIELYAEFSRSGATYTPFPDPRSHRLALADLTQQATRQRLRAVWTDPESLNPARASARVTREVAAQLAELARSLEASKHRPEQVAAFLTRCLFCMFAEDVELLPKGSFLNLLQAWREDPRTLQRMLHALWTDMDRGGFSIALATQLLRFNGKLFKFSASDGYSLLLNAEQIDQLITSARSNWREVEPAIFGTLLERALDPQERHALGAHYTPRAYVERLVLPTVVEPLRADWANAQAAALVLAHEAGELQGRQREQKMEQARAELRKFHHQLCSVRVLDPACGSGNFLYVTLEHLKRLEGEVLNQLEALGQTQALLGLEGETVTPQQLLGIELNERAATLAELVLWIGYLQWHIRTRGNKAVAEPVVHDYGNIEHRDAVLAYDATDLAVDADGKLLTRWDGRSYKTHPVTGALVPNENAQTPQFSYTNPRQAMWPQADFIVGNPPFIGTSTMRAALGDGYVEALRGAWPEVPESADFVMHWWSRAAALVGQGATRRFGFITTNSLRQTFNRRVVEKALNPSVVAAAAAVVPAKAGTQHGASEDAPSGEAGRGARTAGALMKHPKSVAGSPHPTTGPVSLLFAIPDHPWVDNANGAAVRIAMTVGMRSGDAPFFGSDPDASFYGSNDDAPFFGAKGRLLTVTNERTAEFGEVAVTLSEKVGVIHADLSIGANVASAVALQANANISSPGVKLHGAGFIVTPDEAAALGLGSVPGLERHIRQYRNGRDLTDAPRGVLVIDLFGLESEQVRARFPAVYQRIMERVKPEREQNNRATYRDNWWIFGEPRRELRPVLAGLPRYIATVETSKHRTFQFLDASILPDNMLIAIASDSALHLGLLSSSAHVTWSLATGGRLGVGNDPRYNKSRCFETFPFPDDDTGLTPALRERIGALAEQIDALRKRVLASGRAPERAPAGVKLTLTGLYNVLEALREGRALTDKEKAIHQAGLVGVLKDLHDELDGAVLAAYGWSDLAAALGPGMRRDDGGAVAKQELLSRLVALNAQRAAEEQSGRIRWLRPDFQDPERRAALAAQLSSTASGEQPAAPMRQSDLALGEGQQTSSGIDAAGGARPTTQAKPAKPETQAWPSALPNQVRAVAQLLAASPTALSLQTIEASFKGKGAWKKTLPRILETLEALGRASRVDGAWRY